ncbi:MAG TPA: hypothetical protein VNA25_14960, partial [Phycisphaerae bacterium]|nr:hypothetical protein [Phycisphaerae bacterium]
MTAELLRSAGVVLAALSLVGGPLSANAQPAGGPKPLLLEGFEQAHKVKTAPGKLEPVSEGEGISQGRAAVSVPPGQSIYLDVKAADLRQHAWLKLDTLTLQPLNHRFYICIAQKDWYRTRYAYVQAGKDTLALPLSFLSRSWPDGQLELTLRNASDRSVILDNLRLEKAAPAPAGCVLLDFGPDHQVVWPGFARTGAESEHVTWSGRQPIVTGHMGYPDPLGGDFVGPALGMKVSDSFDLVSPAVDSAAWMWVTHHGSWRTQPAEYMLSLGRRRLVSGRLTRGQVLGPDGLMAGMNGDWTPQWFDTVYAPRFVQFVRVGLKAGRNRFAVGNCQLAAVVVCPPGVRDATSGYVERVRADLSRFRRQFVVGDHYQPVCHLSPTEAETKTGLILLRPPADLAFAPDWQPTQSDRIDKVSVLAANGLLVTTPIAIAPLKATGAISAGLGPLRSAQQKLLPLKREPTAVVFCKTVPKVVDGRACRQPYILTNRHPPAAERQLVLILLRLIPAPEAAPGVYQGELRLTLGSSSAQIPVEVELADIGAATDSSPTVGFLSSGGPGHFYGPLLMDGLSQAAQDSLTGKVRQQLLEHANALLLSGPLLGVDMNASSGSLTRSLRSYPANLATGCTLFDVQQILEAMQVANVVPGTQRY